ncbi:hypothetical protein [Burkholderia multivorans]|uniref:hypothetical protein n=1 Tax=Burkholderia multivorans TaxID=87883 RepID=UPI0002781B43|nr:hypothetical protein [Burkholderia multivorans]EJO57359.1 hypothetical protein BURMUCF2_A1485 [Burkholderia multivorans CF2]MBU9472090.1 hypothetical protein [Burkholderia multivorans]
MSYELPRAAKLLKDVQSKYIGLDAGRTHKAGKKCKVQRSPAEPGLFIIWFGKTEIAKVPALQLSETIAYTDGRPQL